MRVVLLDCLANSRLFVRDEVFRALAAQLAAAGIEANLVDLIRDEPPAGQSLAEVADSLRTAEPDVVVVSRAWDTDLVESIREAAGVQARLVRHSHGAPSPIDEKFDFVLDSGGILALLASGIELPAPKWRRTRGEMGVLRPLPPPRAGETLPMIGGPAKGCPFLVDARSSPAFRDSGLDFDRVQSKGCSFCLDNVGAYAAFPAEAVVGAWLEQLRALRAERPDIGEVLLTDERPHPYLPAFFQAILDDPALHGIELLIKSRVDWLAEFADNALREACELAERSRSVIHLYLVGFESFHQADLDLFNKAVTVADNVRAVEILRQLAERHPRSFEFRAKRAHGIVLFHPWTTPESLLDNARAMRDLAFHELRSQALRTRLRLYASVPLHALAEAQGLLVEQFDAGRGDRAVEQGYDASVPWRFADQRIEAIYRAANRLTEALPGVLEGDILEMATRFVLRWPAFAEAPDLAALPLLQAPFSWGSSPADVVSIAGCTLAGFDREVESVIAGRKPACLKEGVPIAEAELLLKAYGTMGLEAAIVSTHERGGDDGAHARGSSHAIVAVAREAATLESVLQHQRAVEHGEADHIQPMGELMGYPSCCIEAFRHKRQHGENLDLERGPLLAHPEHPLQPSINRFGAVSFISHMLCAPDCAHSMKLGRERLLMVSALDREAAHRIVTHLSTSVLRLDYRRAALVTGEWEDEIYRVESWQPFHGADFGVDAANVAAIRIDTSQIELLARDGSRRTIATPAPILVEPGRGLAAPMRRVLEQQAQRHARPQAPPARESTAEGETAPVGVESLLPILKPGTAVASFVVDDVSDDGEGGLQVTLASESSRLRVRIRTWVSSRPALSRRGSWALDLFDGETPTNSERTVVGALARLLPSGHHQEGSPTPPPGPEQGKPIKVAPAADKPGVICTTPWTTLEVVDPDGPVRQCCADWTVGGRGWLRENSLAEIWNGPGYQMARRVMSGNDLSSLCNATCPRLYDAKFAERELTFIPGAPAFEENQRQLFEEIANRREVIRAHPLYVAVCPSTYCNYNCIMCLHGRTPRRDLPESIWDDLVRMLPSLHVLTLLGGEPLANPLAMKFLRAWDRTKTPDASVSIVTNGSLLTAGVLAQLDRCRFGSVTVSLNAGTPDVYAAVQRGIDLDSVLANIDALIELRRRQNSNFPIVLSCVVQPANHTTLVAFAELARARDLPIRLMPLSPNGPDGLDFYDDQDEVARLLASLDRMSTWAENAAPSYQREILGTRSAIAAEAARRRPAAPSAG